MKNSKAEKMAKGSMMDSCAPKKMAAGGVAKIRLKEATADGKPIIVKKLSKKK